MSKALQIFIWANFTLIFLFILYLGYLQVYPFEIIKFPDEMQVLTKEVKAGERLEYRQQVNKLIQKSAHKLCRLEDGIVYNYRSTESDIPIGATDQTITVLIPEGISEGKYRYICDLIYEISPFREIKYTLKTEVFKVIN